MKCDNIVPMNLLRSALLWPAALALCCAIQASGGEAAPAPTVVVAEGEAFKPLDDKGWKVTFQDDSYASHTYGGMWVTNGGLLGAPAESEGSVAVQAVNVPAAGKYRVWSKYQAPPYYNYLHKIEIAQGGKTVYAQVYGKDKTPRLWSFSGQAGVLWWPWGSDHDAAEAPKELAELAAGPAEIRLVTVANEQPAGDRFVDFVLLTTSPADNYQGFKPNAVGSPFANEALAATQLFMRFQNPAQAGAKLTVKRTGHFQPNYGGASGDFPQAEVAAGQWSEWFNIGPFCRLVHDEGLWLSLKAAQPVQEPFAVQFARDAGGKDLVGDLKVAGGEAVSVPIDITWRKDAKVLTSRQHAEAVIALCKTWRTANGGKKPKQILFYGDFRNEKPWVAQLKDALGYNTLLPEGYETAKPDGLHAHVFGVDAIRKFAAQLQNKKDFLVLSFGDEIGLGQIKYEDPVLQPRFTAWLKAKGIGKDELGVNPEEAKLTNPSSPAPAGKLEEHQRLAWYSNLFNEEETFAVYRENTRVAKEAIGPHVLTGANFSPHHLALYYGPIFQWVDLFKHEGMGMFWAEDYIFSVPEVPQIISWQFAQMRCGVKYHNQPIHFYVMPHAPGQTPEFLRRNMLLSVGYGARHINSFWVAPEEDYTENFVAWGRNETFRTIHESVFDTAEAERFQAGGTLRPAHVALIIGKATDFNESRLMMDKASDPFAKDSENAPAQINQTLCRKEQQMLYLALKHAQVAVDLITEDDIAEDDALKQYQVVYFAGEWSDTRAVKKLAAWVENGGVLYASGGIGHLNQFNLPNPEMLALLGLKSVTGKKNLVAPRTLLELPLAPAIGAITLQERAITATGLRQVLEPGAAKVLGEWDDGNAAVTVHELGKGQAYAVGTLAGCVYMESGLKKIPYARGGRHTVYNPTDFAPVAKRLVWLGVEAKPLSRDVFCSNPLVEAILMDHPDGALLTLVNWTNSPIKDLKVEIKLNYVPKSARSVEAQKSVALEPVAGGVKVTSDLNWADYILLPK
ncbi:MAG: beta-galactosidase trimerization domain-containing protein [Planctomycetota bacterium]